MKIKAQVSDKKIEIVKEFSDLIKDKRTILIASIKNLPASQFQDISKKLRGKAIVKVPKKNLILKAVNDSENGKVKSISEYVNEDIAILFSDLDSFDLASELLDNKSPTKAKPGQKAPSDILVEAGPTELLPGPAMTELASVGLQIQVDKGKLAIKEDKVIVKEGQKISAAAADVMNKLDIKPFSVGFIPLVAYDTKEEKLYSEININKEETVEALKSSFGKALAFAVEMHYSSADTIKFLLAKAGVHGKILENLTGKEEVKEDEKTEEVKSDGEENKEESAEEKKEDAEEVKEDNSKEEQKNERGDKEEVKENNIPEKNSEEKQ